MKTSAVLASLLFGSFAVAAPVDRRDIIKTEVVIETVVVWTTIYEDEAVAEATTTPAGYFYEQPKAPSSAAATSTSSQVPAYTPPAEVKSSSSVYVAPTPQAPTATPSPQPVTSAAYVAPAPVVSSVAPVVSSAAYVAPAPVVSSAAPAVSSVAPVAQVQPASGDTTTTGAAYTNVDMTIYDNNGSSGACGVPLYDTDVIVALAQPTWGQSTYNVMTGAATNPWCGQKIKINYNGNSIVATIMDLCPGCVGADIDLSLAAWKALTGLEEKTRLKASWSKVS